MKKEVTIIESMFETLCNKSTKLIESKGRLSYKAATFAELKEKAAELGLKVDKKTDKRSVIRN